MKEVSRKDSEKGRFYPVFLASRDDKRRVQSRIAAPSLELTYNWDPEEYSGAETSVHCPIGSTGPIYQFVRGTCEAGGRYH